jgi:alkylation response protein AidB-like acyl-CoA dehydrogenase
MAMLPKEYGGAGLSCLDYVIACEEITSIDPGFACTCLCNGLGLMPVLWYGSEEQKTRFLGAATSDPTGTYLILAPGPPASLRAAPVELRISTALFPRRASA